MHMRAWNGTMHFAGCIFAMQVVHVRETLDALFVKNEKMYFFFFKKKKEDRIGIWL